MAKRRRLSVKQRNQLDVLDTVDRGAWATGILLAMANVTYDMLLERGWVESDAKDFVHKAIAATPGRFGQEVNNVNEQQSA